MLTYVEKNEDEANGVLHSKSDSAPLLLSSILSWTKDGTAFVIKNKKDFLEHVLPLFFHPSNKFPSFTRKLYRWGFRQISHLPGEIPKSRVSMIFGHEYFQRDDKSLMIHMKSITAAGTRRAMAKKAADKKLQGNKKKKDMAELGSAMAMANQEVAQQQQPKELQKTPKELFQIPQLHSLKHDKMKETSSAKLLPSGITGKQLPLLSSFLQPKPLSWLMEGEVTPRHPVLKDIIVSQAMKTAQDSTRSFYGLNNASTKDAVSKENTSGSGDGRREGSSPSPDINASLLSSALAASAASRYAGGDGSNTTSDATTRFLSSLATLQQAEAVLACLRSTSPLDATTSSLRSPAWNRDVTVPAAKSSVPYSVHAGLQNSPIEEAASASPVTLANATDEAAAHNGAASSTASRIGTAVHEAPEVTTSVTGEFKQEIFDPSATSADEGRLQDLQASGSAPESTENGYGSVSHNTATEPVLEAVHALLGFSS